MVELTNQVNRTIGDLGRKLGRLPDVDEIGAAMEVAPDRITTVLRLVKEPVSLQTPLADSEQTLADIVPDQRVPEIAALMLEARCRDEIRRVLKSLSPREEKILRMRFGIQESTDYTLEETGKLFGITRERTRQIEAAALRKLRCRHTAVRER
jgi:RNA polymerase primary sigma factor